MLDFYSAAEVKEQMIEIIRNRRKLRFSSALKRGYYRSAERTARFMEDTLVCYCVSRHLDNLIAFKRAEDAINVAYRFERHLDMYLAYTHKSVLRKL